MERTKRYIIFFLLLVVSVGLIGCGENGPSQSANVVGTVADTALIPISGASVVVGSVSSSSGSDGSYTLERVTNGLQNFSVSASGYVSVSKTIDVAPMTTTYISKIILEKRDSKSTDIGSGGGDVANSDGSVKLSIPAAALSSDISIVITNCNLLSAPLPVPDGYKLVSLVYISPIGTVLAQPVTLSIIPSETPVSFYWFDVSASEWKSLGAGTVSSGTVSVSVNNFGWIAAVVPISAGNISGKVVSSAGGAITGADIRTSSNLTVTDSSGNYTLSNLPVGTVSVTASKVGYEEGTTSVVVKAGETVSAGNITLSPVSSYGSVSGKILAASGSGVISGARIVASGKTSYSDSNGDYIISGLTPGIVTVSVYATGYVNQEDPAVSITAGGTASKNFRLENVAVSEFVDDFEGANKGWNISGLWNRVDNPQDIRDVLIDGNYVSLPDAGYLPSAKSATHVYWFGNSDTGSYIGTQDIPNERVHSGGTSTTVQIGTLESPSISLVGYSNATLSFWTWWEVESRNISSIGSSFDLMQVSISCDGVNWNPLGRMNPDSSSGNDYIPYSSGGYNKLGEWVKHQYDLTSYVGKSVRIRFEFFSLDQYSNGFRGWFIDDVSISKDAISAASSKKLY